MWDPRCNTVARASGFCLSAALLWLYHRCCSVTRSCPTLCDPVDCSTAGFPVLNHLLEFAQTRVLWLYYSTSGQPRSANGHQWSDPTKASALFPGRWSWEDRSLSDDNCLTGGQSVPDPPAKAKPGALTTSLTRPSKTTPPAPPLPHPRVSENAQGKPEMSSPSDVRVPTWVLVGPRVEP